MKTLIDVPPYVQADGIRLEWDDGFEIRAEMLGREVVISANVPGLRSLARHLLALSQQGVPAGTHVHFDDSNSLEDGSLSLVFERR